MESIIRNIRTFCVFINYGTQGYLYGIFQKYSEAVALQLFMRKYYLRTVCLVMHERIHYIIIPVMKGLKYRVNIVNKWLTESTSYTCIVKVEVNFLYGRVPGFPIESIELLPVVIVHS